MRASRRRLGLAVLAAVLALSAAAAAFVSPLRRLVWPAAPRVSAEREAAALAGSESCRKCHAAFFEKWSTSFHGLAMRAYSAAFARDHLTPMDKALAVGGATYRAVIGSSVDGIEERTPGGTRSYPIAQVLGGKNVVYFLTPTERGFLQTLPLAYDVRRREWFSTPGSAVRHFEGTNGELPWTDRAYTFNTSCFGCHVSQLSTNYDPASDSYRTVWAEPGINCETCHGPAGEHVRVCERSRPGAPVPDARIVSVKQLTREQRNDLCGSKANPLWTSFAPGDLFFDHFDLTTLEAPDYYVDGRDLGENYTFTSWRMSPCMRSGLIDCMHCHTSSGRYKWKDDPNGACRGCHESRVREVLGHSHHRAGSPGAVCAACHMPKTEFARMRRSDHSMRPPVPAATLAFGSPNACTACHAERDARWALRTVTAWRGGGPSRFERRVLREGRLVAAARVGDWSQLSGMLAFLRERGHDEIVTASLVRLLGACPDPTVGPVLRSLAADGSPLVRGAVVAALGAEPENLATLVAATRDPLRLVRVRAAAALSGRDLAAVLPGDRSGVEAATAELERSLAARPDQFGSHYNLGNLDLARGAPAEAVAHYQKALELRADHEVSLVNLSMAYARLGRLAEAEPPLRKALEVQPRSVAARFNLGLLLAETGRQAEAKGELGRALELGPRNAAAAYNLALLVAEQDPLQAVALAHRAAAAAPHEPRYAWTEAYISARGGDIASARRVLGTLVREQPGYVEGWRLLGDLVEKTSRAAEAAEVYRRASGTTALSEMDRQVFRARMRQLTSHRGR